MSIRSWLSLVVLGGCLCLVKADHGVDESGLVSAASARKAPENKINFGGHSITGTGAITLSKSNPDGSEDSHTQALSKKIGLNDDRDIETGNVLETNAGGPGSSSASAKAKEKDFAKKLKLGPASTHIAHTMRQAETHATKDAEDDDD